MYGNFKDHLQSELTAIEDAGLYKREVAITSAQGAHVAIENNSDMLNLCANNYLGLAQHPSVNQAAADGLANEWGWERDAPQRIYMGVNSWAELDDMHPRWFVGRQAGFEEKQLGTKEV